MANREPSPGGSPEGSGPEFCKYYAGSIRQT
uniref:Uncharacterized protein n=1 Tax=Arundo donax TaxID=35708 RepID=A0A0A9HL83_ARUDO